MTRRRSSLWTSRVAAFLAVALLTFAGVKSAVMQTAMALSVADCGMSQAEMAGMAGMTADPFAEPAPKASAPSDGAGKAQTGKAAPEICGYCVDAAHAPVVAYAEPLRPPSAVRFTPTPARPPLGARAPPTIPPKARGPPTVLLTA